MRTLFLSLCLLTASAFAADDYPRGKLPAGVTPLSYRLDLTIVPEQARFSGHAEIDIELKDATQSIYLHGRELKMTSAVAIRGKDRIEAKYTELDNLGTARIDFSQRLQAGKLTLSFDYDAPFNDGPSGLYRIKVADEWYSWTQFQSIDARAAFPSFDEPGFKTP
ncbi:MAG TPA: hypothetical protein VNA21_06100, partial [Steroidobacteraceae bacterium]|nr:hypothetical protein [Steroidobacteraceae bacterium]